MPAIPINRNAENTQPGSARADPGCVLFGRFPADARAYRCVSIMYIWITTSGENVNGTQP